MLIINNRTHKRTKLHSFTCIICQTDFGSYRTVGKVCSKQCGNKLNSILKNKSFPRECVRCKEIFLCKPSHDRRGGVRKYCSRSCQNKFKKLSLPIGQYYSYDKYIVMNKTPDGRKQIKLHRYLMEQHIGRKLLPTEIVHHINENKLDNQLSNLQIVTRHEHNLIHHPKQ
jgi:hypothetical protein